MKLLPGSVVESRLDLVTVRFPQKLAPPPACVTPAAYLPFERNCVCGMIVCGVR